MYIGYVAIFSANIHKIVQENVSKYESCLPNYDHAFSLLKKHISSLKKLQIKLVNAVLFLFLAKFYQKTSHRC